MRADGTAFRILTAAAAGICVTLAGCASGGGTQSPAARTSTPSQQAKTQRHSQPTRPSRGPAAQMAAGTSRRPATKPPASRRKFAAMLASGLYTDGADGSPHYILSFTSDRGGVVRGSASFMYQDGRIAAAGSYAGTLSGKRKLTLTFSDGKALSGSYTAGRLDLAGCAKVLHLAAFLGGCSFGYHGHVP